MNSTINKINNIIKKNQIEKNLHLEKQGDTKSLLYSNYLMVFTSLLAFITFLISYNTGKDFNEKYIWILISFVLLGIIGVFGFLYQGMIK